MARATPTVLPDEGRGAGFTDGPSLMRGRGAGSTDRPSPMRGAAWATPTGLSPDEGRGAGFTDRPSPMRGWGAGGIAVARFLLSPQTVGAQRQPSPHAKQRLGI